MLALTCYYCGDRVNICKNPENKKGKIALCEFCLFCLLETKKNHTCTNCGTDFGEIAGANNSFSGDDSYLSICEVCFDILPSQKKIS